MKLSGLVGIFFLVISSVLVSAEPAWFLDQSKAGYNLSNYILGTGKATGYDAAIGDAQRQISEQLRVNVKSVFVITEKETARTNTQIIEKHLNARIQTTVEEVLDGVQVVEGVNEGGFAYVLAVLDKRKFAELLSQSLDRLGRDMKALDKTAFSFREQLHIELALQNYISLYEKLLTRISKKEIHDVVAKKPYKKADFSLSEVDGKIQSLLMQIRFASSVEGALDGVLGQEFNQPITVHLVFPGFGGMVPLTNVPIHLRYSDGTVAHSIRTDADGMASFSPIAYALDAEPYALVAEIDFPFVDDRWAEYFSHRKLKIPYTISGLPTSELLKITVVDAKGKSVRNLEKSLQFQVQELGFGVSKKGTLQLKGEILKQDEKSVNSLSGTLVVSKIEVSLQLYNGDDFIGAVTVVGKGIESNSSKAFKKAVDSVRLDRKSFSRLMGKL